MPMVLQAFRYGDRDLFQAHPDLDQAVIWVHFHAKEAKYNRTEKWGIFSDYQIGLAANPNGKEIAKRISR